MHKYKFCPNCKGLLKTNSNHKHCLKCGMEIYFNSKPTAGVLPVKDGKVLIGKRGVNPYKGKYDVIGGFLENGEQPEDGAIREVYEETGLKIKLIKFLGHYIDRYKNDYKNGGYYTLNIYFIAKIVGGKMKAKDDIASLHWVDINKIPKMAFKHQAGVIKDFKNYYKSRLA